jgi:hypothetical protein
MLMRELEEEKEHALRLMGKRKNNKNSLCTGYGLSARKKNEGDSACQRFF